MLNCHCYHHPDIVPSDWNLLKPLNVAEVNKANPGVNSSDCHCFLIHQSGIARVPFFQCTMAKLKNEPKSMKLWKYFSPWLLMLKVPNFKQRYLNSQKMEICKNIWKYWGKVGGKFQKTWRGWLIKSRLVSKNPSRRADFFCKIVIFIIPPLIPKKCVYVWKI